MIISPRCLDNSWLFRSHRNDRAVFDLGNSIATVESEEAERAVVDWIRDHPRRPLTEWSDLADPFEPAGWHDWSPVRSVRLATPAPKSRYVDVDPEAAQYWALRRERKEIARAVAALLTGRTRKVRSDKGRARGPRSTDIPAILDELHARMDACS